MYQLFDDDNLVSDPSLAKPPSAVVDFLGLVCGRIVARDGRTGLVGTDEAF